MSVSAWEGVGETGPSSGMVVSRLIFVYLGGFEFVESNDDSVPYSIWLFYVFCCHRILSGYLHTVIY